MPRPKIFCLILNYNHFEDTAQCIKSILSSDIPKQTEILIIDNSPDDQSVIYLHKKFPKIKIIRNIKNLGFAGGNNVGIKYALSHHATHILIINPDVVIGKKFFKLLLPDLSNNSQIGLIAPAIKHLQNNQVFYGLEGNIDWLRAKATHTNLRKTPKSNKLIFGDFVTFACVLIKAEVFPKTGLLDTRYFMYLEDVDFCLSATQSGFSSAVNPQVIVDHRTSSSFKRPTDKLKISFVSQLKFIDKWLKFPRNLYPYFYQLLFYPYLYFLWTAHYYKLKSK